jgi:hypothetical protein
MNRENTKMMSTIRAVVRGGKVELLEPMELPEGMDALVTLLSEDSDMEFWSQAAAPAAAAIWDNAEDDIYAELLAH